jgi:hypothetical protein
LFNDINRWRSDRVASLVVVIVVVVVVVVVKWFGGGTRVEYILDGVLTLSL